jgi:1,4-alpha-glucan branching enzyme
MIHKRPSPSPGKVLVAFEIPGTVWAERINLVGDFNDWDRESLPLQLGRNENWRVELELDEGTEYRFRYLMDGDYWGYDWHADKHLTGADGSCDSVIVAELGPMA